MTTVEKLRAALEVQAMAYEDDLKALRQENERFRDALLVARELAHDATTTDIVHGKIKAVITEALAPANRQPDEGTDHHGNAEAQ